MTAVLLLLVVAGTVSGDLLKAHGMRRQGAPDSFKGIVLRRFAVAALRNPWFLLSLAAYAASLLSFMALLSYEDVSFVVPATALAYVAETLLASVVLREQVSRRRWIGAALVSAGVYLVA